MTGTDPGKTLGKNTPLPLYHVPGHNSGEAEVAIASTAKVPRLPRESLVCCLPSLAFEMFHN